MKKLNILFILSKNRIRKDGLAPLKARITYLNKNKEFSVGIFIKPEYWDSVFQEAKPPNEFNSFINSQLNLIKVRINQVFLYLQVNHPNFTVDDIYKKFKGEPAKNESGVIEVYHKYLFRIENLIGIEIQLATYKKYKESLVHLKSFIRHKYKKNDILLIDLNYNFIDDYEYFLKVEQKLQLSTLNKAIQRFRKVISYALAQDYLNKDPFIGYRAKRQKKEVLFLNKIELKALENKKFAIVRLDLIKDMFVFCCYTGLGFKEMFNLKYEDIVSKNDANIWIRVKRNKTNKNYHLPLLEQAVTLIEKYKNDTEYIFPRISNQKFNAYLKEIADVVGININLTHHIARKTFASTVLLYNDVPMEIVSELLGHSKISTTQEYYAKIVQKKVSEQIQRLSDKLKA